MKGDLYRFTPKKMDDAGISPCVTRLTDDGFTCNHLYFHNRSFTPDDRYVLFESTRDGGNNLFAMEPSTGMATQLTQGYDLDYFPYPARDGKKVFFGHNKCIKTVDIETFEEEVILNAQDLVEEELKQCSGPFPSWDGKKVVCFYETKSLSDNGLIVIDMETRAAKIITHGPQRVRHCQFALRIAI